MKPPPHLVSFNHESLPPSPPNTVTSMAGYGFIMAILDENHVMEEGTLEIDIFLCFPDVYKQPGYVPKTKNFITTAGFAPEHTAQTWNNTFTKIKHHQIFNSDLEPLTIDWSFN